MADLFPLNRYPFLAGSRHVIEELALTIDRIDKSNVFDQAIKESLVDIIKAFSKTQTITPEVSNDIRYEVAKFYITLYILRSNPTKLMTRYWLKAYMKRQEKFIWDDMHKHSFTYVSKLFDELGMPHKFVRVDGYEWMIIKVMDYLEFALEIKRSDSIEYQKLTLTNVPLHKGRVFIHTTEIDTFFCMLVKLSEKRIKELLDRSDQVIRSMKIDDCVDQLQKFIVDTSALDGNHKVEKQLEFGETTPEIEIQNDQVLKELFTDKALTHIDIKSFPPCINVIINKLNNKQGALGHRENILLGTYLASRGFTQEQIIDIYKMAVNYDANTTKYNVEYLLEKKIKPFNCDKADKDFHLCYADESCKRLKLQNPMNYRRLEK